MRNTLPQIHGNSAHPAAKLTNKSYTNYRCTVKGCRFRNALSHSLCPKPKCDAGAHILLQRVLWNLSIYKGPRVIPACGIGASSLCKGDVFDAPSTQQARPLVT